MLRSPNPALWAVFRPLLRLILRLRLRFKAPFARMKAPYVLLCNHASYYDPLLAAVCVDRPLCFAGADPAPRAGLLLRLARALRQPDALSWEAALTEAAESGRCVGLFPEGRRCPDGGTGPIPGDLAEKIRASGLGLVVLRLEGVYLTAPRWADRIPRRGRIRARLKRRLSPGVLQAMENEELQALIEKDLHENAFASVRKRPAPYRGERTAERLEKLLCLCPKCGDLGSMESRDNEFFCRTCGFRTVYTLSGGFRGGGVPFEDPGQWAAWQAERIRRRCEEAGDGPIFEDGGYEIYDMRSGEGRFGAGGLHLYRDRLELPTGIAIAVPDILSLRALGGSGLRVETRRGSVFELKTIRPICAEKYLTALAILKEEAEAAAETAAEEAEETLPEAEESAVTEPDPDESGAPETEEAPGEAGEAEEHTESEAAESSGEAEA